MSMTRQASPRSQTKPMVAAIAVVMVLLQSCIPAVPAWLPSTQTPMSSRRIVQRGLPLRELWRRSGLLISNSMMPAGVLATEKHVFFVDYNLVRLQVLDATTGQLEWQVADLPNEHSLATDLERLFIAVNWNIQAYNLSDGKLLWRTPGELPGHTTYRLYPMGKEIWAYSTESSFGKSEQVIRAYDASDGTLKWQSRTGEADNTYMVFRSPSVDYWGNSDSLWAIDRSSNKTLWQIKTTSPASLWPTLTDSMIILSGRQFWGAPAELYALDAGTGATVWQYAAKCLSNFVMSNNTIYAITESTALVGLDPRTGREKGYVTFTTVKAEDNTQYWVAAAGDKVFAYFGDSQELIAFGP